MRHRCGIGTRRNLKGGRVDLELAWLRRLSAFWVCISGSGQPSERLDAQFPVPDTVANTPPAIAEKSVFTQGLSSCERPNRAIGLGLAMNGGARHSFAGESNSVRR